MTLFCYCSVLLFLCLFCKFQSERNNKYDLENVSIVIKQIYRFLFWFLVFWKVGRWFKLVIIKLLFSVGKIFFSFTAAKKAFWNWETIFLTQGRKMLWSNPVLSSNFCFSNGKILMFKFVEIIWIEMVAWNIQTYVGADVVVW